MGATQVQLNVTPQERVEQTAERTGKRGVKAPRRENIEKSKSVQ